MTYRQLNELKDELKIVKDRARLLEQLIARYSPLATRSNAPPAYPVTEWEGKLRKSLSQKTHPKAELATA